MAMPPQEVVFKLTQLYQPGTDTWLALLRHVTALQTDPVFCNPDMVDDANLKAHLVASYVPVGATEQSSAPVGSVHKQFAHWPLLVVGCTLMGSAVIAAPIYGVQSLLENYLKHRDPTFKVVVGGIARATPILRTLSGHVSQVAAGPMVVMGACATVFTAVQQAVGKVGDKRRLPATTQPNDAVRMGSVKPNTARPRPTFPPHGANGDTGCKAA